ncbi:MAG: TolC family protein [Myxococcota bacterium]|jgi:outer membrane protein TolC|nr:TolC family protein [Myxococcota bacterium]
MQNKCLALSFVLTLIGGTALAQEVPQSLSDCLELALKNNVNFLASQESVHVKDAQKSVAQRKLLPSLSLSSSAYRTVENTNFSGARIDAQSNALTLAQPLYRGRALWAGMQSAGLDFESAKLGLAREEHKLIRDVKQLWYSLLGKQMLQKNAEQSLERLKEHAKNTTHFFAEGRIWRNDVLQAEVEVARGEQNLILARNQVILTKARLNQLLHRDIEAVIASEDVLAWQEHTSTYDDALAFALENRPDLKRFVLSVQMQGYGETIASAGLQPQLALQASYNLASSDFDIYAKTSQVLVSLNWNLWEWGNTLKSMEIARSTTKQAKYQLEAAKLQVKVDVQKAWLGVQESAKRVEVLKKAVTQAQENYRVSGVRYREELGSANDVLIAQGLATQTQGDYISALSSYLTALADLDLATGQEWK